MDGLALLCTLHADGPATLKRLRGAGCANLTALLERPITEVALALDVAPAAARRLLREARLLAERVGPELEAEEGPAAVAAPSGPEPLAVELPPATPTSTLDQGDRALLARIVRDGRTARPESGGASANEWTPVAGPVAGPVGNRVSEVPTPGLAPAPTALERSGLDLSAEGPWPTLAPESMQSSVEHAEPPPVESAPVESAQAEEESDLAPLLALEGVDAALARELVRAGVRTLADLARADALMLARALQVTFAQAKRLCFLARRSASSGPLPMASRTSQAPTSARVAPPPSVATAPPAAVPPAAAPPAPSSSAPRQAWRIELRTQPLVSAQEVSGPPAMAPPVMAPPPVTSATTSAEMPAVAARPRFWEPRPAVGPEAPERSCEPQGVLVDPAEVDRPRRISDVRRPAAQPASGAAARHFAGHAGTSQASPPAAPRHGEPTATPRTGGTTLGWNFEIPRPESAPTAEPVPARRTWRPLEQDGLGADETSAGPFA